MGKKLIGYILLIVALLLVAVVAYYNTRQSGQQLVFTPTQVLTSTWQEYKKQYVEEGTYRTIDKNRNNDTTSEGQSYTMLRAVWMGDKQTFDGAWGWTQQNLYHTNDHLFAWLWGQKPGSTAYGVLTNQGGETTASDADTDIALSLVFAYGRWQDPAYLTAARGIITDIWDKEVVVVGGTPYMSADNLEKTSTNNIAAINPSYLNPAAYRIFAQVDTTHSWSALVDSSYTLLQKSIASPLDTGGSAGLPPDWLALNKTTGAITALSNTNNTTHFGYDAMRIPFRLALDHAWFNDKRDKAILQSMSFLSKEWRGQQKLASVYAHDGTVVTPAESAAIYGGTIGYFTVADPSNAKTVYTQKLEYLYNSGTNTWKQVLSYYDDNWAWFGVGVYNNLLPNLVAGLPASAFK